ncbi:S-adenosylmethionine--tRNA ribosyltransferase-isomerase [Candidatus Phycorickettsia trachydisci]|uniref:S-adenosylmethionine:tRNA ribosyltransferase-isomerase n=1 Tax=Candidatus Phycorickettsia trachydisci TaxID=2115978 RepID=A0A2P1P8M5_9RICK|nr:tRNA preQ1(34) S-adenosylmethionine ribosyltransferase-isomerase QueA [Candidatus Phycorickettsia trachydisci]AVP87607.1 S-adenosylmethionine--tRNA ribosyltransferase-isomerase [Candidatus Phycorickettsia trachydisci]
MKNDPLKVSDLDFPLDTKQIALNPLEKRDESRLLVIKGQNLKEIVFKDIVDLFHPGDVLVLNNSKVIKSRIIVSLEGKNIELFLHKQIEENRWQAFAKPAKKLSIGQVFSLGDNKIRVAEKLESGEVILELNLVLSSLEFFDQFGKIPLPPYIKRPSEKSDEEQYQTIFAANSGSVAAPTAGLHFTQEVLDKIKAKGAQVVYITLHVGAGTFLPIKSENVDDHEMHYENYEISQETAQIINDAKRVVAVGTTTLRTLESSCEDGKVIAQKSSTNLFIKPGFKFHVVDLLITNFHLPKSTLLLLVWAFGGRNNMEKAYDYAVKNNFRLFSYGDTSLIYHV